MMIARISRKQFLKIAVLSSGATALGVGCTDSGNDGAATGAGSTGGSGGSGGLPGGGTGGTPAGFGGSGGSGGSTGGSAGTSMGGSGGSGGSTGGSGATSMGGSGGSGGSTGGSGGGMGEGGMGAGGEGGVDAPCIDGVQVQHLTEDLNHDHLPLEEPFTAQMISMNMPMTLELPFQNDHIHTITFTEDDFTALQDGMVLEKENDPDDTAHTHEYAITLCSEGGGA